MHKHEGTLKLATFSFIFDFIIEGCLVLGVRALRVVELVVSCIGRVVCHDCLLSVRVSPISFSNGVSDFRYNLKYSTENRWYATQQCRASVNARCLRARCFVEISTILRNETRNLLVLSWKWNLFAIFKLIKAFLVAVFRVYKASIVSKPRKHTACIKPGHSARTHLVAVRREHSPEKECLSLKTTKRTRAAGVSNFITCCLKQWFFVGTYFATVAFVRLISRPLAGGYPTARRLSRRASGLEFDDVTPQWPADIAKWMVSDAIFPSALGGDVCIVLVRDCTPDQRRTTRELESGTHQIIRTPTSHEYTPNNPGIRK